MHTPRTTGLSPTLRQLMILVLAAGTFCSALVFCYKHGILGERPEVVCLNLSLMVGVWAVPWLMILVFAFDRRGPVRNGLMARLMAGGGFWTAAAFLIADPASWALSGRFTLIFPVLPVTGLVCLVAAVFAMRSVRPGLCSACGRRSVIGVATKFEANRVRRDSGWCASCGAEYERENMGDWKASTDSREG